MLLVALPHELAHLLVARRFGVTVHEFGLGLPPRMWSFQWRSIRWSVNWLLPFGAFVRLKGEQTGDAADDFAALPARQRVLVVAAGPMANLLVALAAVVLSGVLIGVPTGLQADGAMGYRPARDPLDAVAGLAEVTSRSQQPQPIVLSWVGVAQVMDELENVGIPPLAWFLALLATLSFGLGITNLVPLPPLDGSRIAVVFVEGFVGRRLQQRWATRLNVLGVAALVVLFLVVTGVDVVRLLSGQPLTHQ